MGLIRDPDAVGRCEYCCCDTYEDELRSVCADCRRVTQVIAKHDRVDRRRPQSPPRALTRGRQLSSEAGD